jgi:predicted nucleotidyltransferase
MEVKLKKTIRAGNSSAVVLPKSWLNQEVRVELVKKSEKDILKDVIDIVGSHMDLSEIIGIYLVGSYARGEEDENSDMDIIVLSSNTSKKIIEHGIYSILIVSGPLLHQKLHQDIFPIGSMLKEAKPLINSEYLEILDIKITKKNVDWYIKTTEERVKDLEKIIKVSKMKGKKCMSDSISYSVILRIRTLMIIMGMIKDKKYSKDLFLKLIGKVGGSLGSYEGYLAVKNKEKESNSASLEEIEKLYEYLKGELKVVRGLLR